MLSLDEAQARLLGAVEPLPVERVALRDALGRYAAADAIAARSQPPFASSAMDGYAIRHADLPGPWRLIGQSTAGRRFDGSVLPGTTVRVFTGAPVPEGADTVLIQEEAERDGDVVRLTGEGPTALGAHVRQVGLDFANGDRLLAAGTRLTPTQLGLLAAGGHGEVRVHRRPRVALLSTGNELVPAGVTPGRDQIVNSNGPMLGSLFTATGADVLDLGIVPDDRAAIAAALHDARDADLLVTVGGASVGDHDLVLPVLTDEGAAIDFWKVAIKPGKPMLTGRLGSTRVMGLPGNPVSAFVCAQLFVLPALRRMAGSPTPVPAPIKARTTASLLANGPRRDHLRARLTWNDGWHVTAAARQDSSMLGVLAANNALIVRPEHAAAAEAGSFVPVMPLDTGMGAP